MLSLFPQILFLAPLSATLIRIALAIIFGYAAWRHFSRPETTSRAFGVFEIVLASALFVGFWTQAAAILSGLLIVANMFSGHPKLYVKTTLLLALVMCISLLVTGAGAFALDMPL